MAPESSDVIAFPDPTEHPFDPNTADLNDLVQKDYKWSVLGQSETQKHIRLRTRTKQPVTILGAYVSGDVLDDETGALPG